MAEIVACVDRKVIGNRLSSHINIPTFIARERGINVGDTLRVALLDDGRILIDTVKKTTNE